MLGWEMVVSTDVSSVRGWGTPAGMVNSGTGPSASRAVDRSPDVLVAAARRGDGEAFMALLDTHDRMLRSLAFRILGDRDQMDDVLQDVALKAFTALPKFRGDASVATWLYRITYTSCLQPPPRSGPDCTSVRSRGRWAIASFRTLVGGHSR